jgi:hypothetical protein
VFLAAQIHHAIHHKPPRIHHKFTTIHHDSPRKNTQFSPDPLEKTQQKSKKKPRQAPELFSYQNLKN